MRRPILSPMLPQTMPPIGRMMKEIAKTAKRRLGRDLREEGVGDDRSEIAVGGVVEPFDEVADEARAEDLAQDRRRHLDVMRNSGR